MKKNILTIGPVTKDHIITTNDSFYQIGGAVFYQNCTLNQLKIGVESIITIGKNDLQLLNSFPDKTQLHKIITDQTLEYTNIYNEKLQRKQKAKLTKQPITPENMKINPTKYKKAIISPLTPTDIPPETIRYLKNQNIETTLVPQGLLRKTDTEGNITPREWKNMPTYLEHVDILSLDETEAKQAFNIKHTTDKQMEKIVKKYELKNLIVTKAEQGSAIHTKNHTTHIPAIKTDKKIDATGLGDTYIAAYIAKKQDNITEKEAGLYASLTAAKKLENKGPLKTKKEEIDKEFNELLDKY